MGKPDITDIEQYLDDCVEIDELAIQDEYIRVSPDYAYWSERYSEAYKHHLELELNRKTIKAQAAKEVRAQIEGMRSAGRVTVAEVDADVEVNSEYLVAKMAEIEADAKVKKLQGILEALRIKKEMLISLGAHLRQDMQREALIKNPS